MIKNKSKMYKLHFFATLIEVTQTNERKPFVKNYIRIIFLFLLSDLTFTFIRTTINGSHN
jgi:hypothetical protein